MEFWRLQSSVNDTEVLTRMAQTAFEIQANREFWGDEVYQKAGNLLEAIEIKLSESNEFNP